ncbi:hypothetical protein EON65_10095 [archaeon]|nr:MAG: hypothetical protein EON65_10095 [archaeon]
MQCISLLFIVLLSCACARFAFSNSWKGLKTVQPSDLVNDASSSITIPAFSKAQHVISTLSNTNITNTVRQVTLLAHSFTTEEFYKICNRISKCKQLEGIVLDGCKLTQEDARSLTQSLRKLSSLRYLSLSHCGIGDEHMTSFCLLAKSPGNITCWDLSDNHLTSESFESLYRILLGSANNTLEKLDLSYNKLGGVLLNLLEETGRKNKLKNIKSFSVKQVSIFI